MDEMDPFLDGGPLLPVLEAVSPGVVALASPVLSAISFPLPFMSVAHCCAGPALGVLLALLGAELGPGPGLFFFSKVK